MFPHLMGMKEYHRLSSEDMGAIIGTSRQTYESKMQRGNFTPFECKAFCRRFGVGFDYLFATIDELTGTDTGEYTQDSNDEEPDESVKQEAE